MEWTDRHYRYMMRLLTRHTTLYTEMIVDETVRHNTTPGTQIAHVYRDKDPIGHKLQRRGKENPEFGPWCGEESRRWPVCELCRVCAQLLYQRDRQSVFLGHGEEERPLVVQLGGGDPHSVAGTHSTHNRHTTRTKSTDTQRAHAKAHTHR